MTPQADTCAKLQVLKLSGCQWTGSYVACFVVVMALRVNLYDSLADYVVWNSFDLIVPSVSWCGMLFALVNHVAVRRSTVHRNLPKVSWLFTCTCSWFLTMSMPFHCTFSNSKFYPIFLSFTAAEKLFPTRLPEPWSALVRKTGLRLWYFVILSDGRDFYRVRWNSSPCFYFINEVVVNGKPWNNIKKCIRDGAPRM